MQINPWGVVKKVGTWFGAGFTDKFSSRLTGRRMTFAKHIAAKLDDCEPWTDHFYNSGISGVRTALKDRDYSSARAILAITTKEGATKHCVELANMALDLISHGEEITFELFTALE